MQRQAWRSLRMGKLRKTAATVNEHEAGAGLGRAERDLLLPAS